MCGEVGCTRPLLCAVRPERAGDHDGGEAFDKSVGLGPTRHDAAMLDAKVGERGGEIPSSQNIIATREAYPR
jgi:hypothetical protein